MRKMKVSLSSLLLWWRKLRNFHHFNDPVELLFLHLLGGDSAALGFHTQYVLGGTPLSSLASDDEHKAVLPSGSPLQIKKKGYNGGGDNGLSSSDNGLDTSRFFLNMK